MGKKQLKKCSKCTWEAYIWLLRWQNIQITFPQRKTHLLHRLNTLIWIFITKLGTYIEAIMAFECFTYELSIAGSDWIKFFLNHCVVLSARSTGAKSEGAFVLQPGGRGVNTTVALWSGTKHQIAEKSLEVVSVPFQPWSGSWCSENTTDPTAHLLLFLAIVLMLLSWCYPTMQSAIGTHQTLTPSFHRMHLRYVW